MKHSYTSVGVQINCVAIRGVNDDEVLAFVDLARRLPVTVRFIELMPFSGNSWDAKQFIGFRELITLIQHSHPDLKQSIVPVDSSNPESSHMFTSPAFAGSVAFITSMTDAFCGTCDRLRLTADGHLKACLHGNEELNLRQHLRSGDREQLLRTIASCVRAKPYALGGRANMFELAQSVHANPGSSRPMIKIGG